MSFLILDNHSYLLGIFILIFPLESVATICISRLFPKALRKAVEISIAFVEYKHDFRGQNCGEILLFDMLPSQLLGGIITL